MIKFKKIAAFALAAVTAVSAMSLTTFADDVSKEEIGTFLNENGEYQTVYTEDLESGNDTYTLFGGAKITFSIGDSVDEAECNNNVRASSKFSATSKPGYEDSVFSIDNADYAGSATIATGKSVYSNRVLDNGTSSTVLIMATPQDEDLTGTVYEVYLYTSKSSSMKYFSLAGKNLTCSAHVESAPSNSRLFVKIINNSDETKNPYVSIAGND